MKNPIKPRVVVFIDWYSPGYKAGGPVRSMINMTAHLAEEFDFFIVTRDSEYGESTPYDSVISDAWNKLSSGEKVWYSSAGTPSLKLWRNLIGEVNPDVVYINGIYSPKFSLLPLIAARRMKCSKIIVAPRGMLGAGALEIHSIKKRLFLKVMKFLKLYNNLVWHVTAKTEYREVLKEIDENAKVIIAPNLPTLHIEISNLTFIQKKHGELKMSFISRISRKKNLLFALESLSYVSEDLLITFDLYGPIDDHENWKMCLETISKLPENIFVNYKGAILPEQINSTFKDYHLFYFPTKHENFGHVILESFMAGRPVLISDQTPWRDLSDIKAGWDLSLSDPSGFSTTLESLATMNQEEYDEWCKGAWALGQSVVNDERVVEVYKGMLRRGIRELGN